MLNAPESNLERFRIINLPVRKSARSSAAIQYGSPVLHAADSASCLTNNVQDDDALSAYCGPTEGERTAGSEQARTANGPEQSVKSAASNKNLPFPELGFAVSVEGL